MATCFCTFCFTLCCWQLLASTLIDSLVQLQVCPWRLEESLTILDSFRVCWPAAAFCSHSAQQQNPLGMLNLRGKGVGTSYRDVARRAASSKGENPYDLLGLPLGAEADSVKPAFRVLARRFHPDMPETGDAEQFQLIRWAAIELSSAAGRERWSSPTRITTTRSTVNLDVEYGKPDDYDIDWSIDFSSDFEYWPFDDVRYVESRDELMDDTPDDIADSFQGDSFFKTR
ncbi:unnamed protein product [Polarella glacialis]|uniref:J domain-containing protein n=1 Tax=Polarella glacialis TaxID=89957 RepID=A0A813HDD1_POLGL|nr:unnamed protein product [Polarella glacialis]CAE8731377.1 unnamed protein product [Polarella glacialis]